MPIRPTTTTAARRLGRLAAFVILMSCATFGGTTRVHADPEGVATSLRSTAAKLSVGRSTACLVANSQVYCWGNGSDGRIGAPTAATVKTPRLLSGGPTDAVGVAVGKDHGCVLRATGRVFCFGRNSYFQLGTEDTGSTSNTLTSPSDFTQISAGDDYTCGLSTSQGVVCWGFNAAFPGPGVLGITYATATKSAAPLQVVPASDNPVAVAAGVGHVCALILSGRVKCWGGNAAGELGNGWGNNMNNSNGIPGEVPYFVQTTGSAGAELTGVTAISNGSGFSCAVLTSGEGRCWGGGAYGNLGWGAATGVRLNPTPIRAAGSLTTLTDIKGIAAGDNNTCIIRQAGTVACFGKNDNGQIGNGTSSASYEYGPVDVTSTQPGMNDVQAVSVGGDFVCALTSTGRVYCWGMGGSGQMGNDATLSTNATPVALAGAASQSITVDAPTSKVIGDDAFTVSATSTSGSTVVFESRSLGVCSVAVATVTLLNVGTCTVRASAGPSGIYVAAPNVDFDISVAAVRPRVTTSAATDRTTTSVTLAGLVNPRGASTTASFIYGTSPTLESGTLSISLGILTGVADQEVSAEVSKLAPGVTYYFRLEGTNSIGSSTGEVKSFVTRGAKASVSTGDAGAEAFSATLAGEVTANEVETTVTFEYGTDSLLGKAESIAVAEKIAGTAAKSVSVSVTKLTAGTTYYFRIVSENAVGKSAGEIKSFKTKGSKPTVVTGSATRATAGMTVNGKVNPKDLETTVRFEYGTDPKLVGAQQTAAKSLTGAEDVDVTAVLIGLSENTTYYYRVTATNIVDSTDGDIKSFTTTRPEGVSINDGDEFTSSESVIVSVVGPSTAVKAILSNDGGFKTTETFDLTNNSADIPWKLQSSREGTFTKIVYVKYVSRFGSQSQAVTDDIILDTTKPVMTTATASAAAPTGSAVTVSRISAKAKASGGVRLSLRGSDTISGIGTIEVRSAANKPATKVNVSRVAGKADGKPRAASQTVTLRTTAKRLQVRVIDRAGNASAWRTVVVR